MATAITPGITKEATHFAGFPPGGFDFFLELQARQDRDWFKANKERYEALWVQPFEALLADLCDRLTDVFPQIGKSQRKIFRIQRDTRFSADKTPYKTHIAGHVQVRPYAGAQYGVVPSMYMHFGLEDNMVGIGNWEISKELVGQFRQAIASERRGVALQKIVDDLNRAGIGLAAHDVLKRVPAPYPQDHPRAELLKLKGISAGAGDIPEELMTKPEFVDWMSNRLHQMAPMAHWLEEVFA